MRKTGTHAVALVLFGTVLSLSTGVTRAQAQPAAQPPAPAPAQAPYPQQPYPQQQPYQPQPYPQQPGYPPPPPYGQAPYGGGVQPWGAPGYATPSGLPPQQAMLMYESQKKSEGIALLLEIVVPGLGSVYGDHAIGAAITWGAMLLGIVMLVSSFEEGVDDGSGGGPGDPTFDPTRVWIGVICLLGGRVYGLIDSWNSTSNYNRALRDRLMGPQVGPMQFGLTSLPTATGGHTVGPRLRFTF